MACDVESEVAQKRIKRWQWVFELVVDGRMDGRLRATEWGW